MPSRRALLAGLVATALPRPSWAEVGAPRWLACAQEPDRGHALFGLREDGTDAFRLPLPARGHAGAAHPRRAEAVVFARRPGRFALVIDCRDGRRLHHLAPPEGMQFNGHGAFDAAGDLLVTVEQRADDSEGFLGLWDARYRRLGQVPTAGLGPHEVLRLPGDVFAVANGGIATDPEDRTKLNLPEMAPSLAYLQDGVLRETVTLPADLHQASIRHLACQGGTLAMALQWEGPADRLVPLLALHRRGEPPRLASAPAPEQALMQGYAGSVAISGDEVAITSPRGGRMHRFAPDGAFLGATLRADICGLAPCPGGFLTTDGLGGVLRIRDGVAQPLALAPRAWDNHLVTL